MAKREAASEIDASVSLRSVIAPGLLSAGVSVAAILLGLPMLVGRIVAEWLDLSSPALGARALLLALAMWAGSAAAKRVRGGSPWRTLLGGLASGLVHALVMAAVTCALGSLIDSGAELRQWLVQLTAEAVQLLTLGCAPVAAALGMLWQLAAAALVGAALSEASLRYGLPGRVAGWAKRARKKAGESSAIGGFRQGGRSRSILLAGALLALLAAPLVLGRYWNYTLGTVGIYVMLGLGLNVVVGMAGLLDLGYAAFFAIGGYTVALLTAPAPHDVGLNFWAVLPLGILLAAAAGVLLGIPVLRMRGDYLAIVTLGFGEIIRLLLKSDALTPFTGGPQGVRAVGGPSLFGLDMNSEVYFMYFIVLGIVLVALVTRRLRVSRVGRAWMAMREDEDVAEAMGIHTLKYKLLAFAVGAAFAGLGGVIFASRNEYAGPEDFNLLVSVNVLCLVIIGGMGSIPGVVVGAIVLKGLPEVLRDLDDYRMLAFGALLIVMMILRPEGLWPSKRVRMELSDAAEEPAVPAGGLEGQS